MKRVSKNSVVYYSVLCQSIIEFNYHSFNVANIRFFFEILAAFVYFSVFTFLCFYWWLNNIVLTIYNLSDLSAC